MSGSHSIHCFRGYEVEPWLQDLARLRIEVLGSWPYLYQGDVTFEYGYLQAYSQSPDSFFVLVIDRGRVVGASTGVPLLDDVSAFSQPFASRAVPARDVFHLGDSVLLPEYRGRGIGSLFFDHRERFVRSLERYRWTAFCALDRSDKDPRRPADAHSSEAFWRRRGYAPKPGLTMRLRWLETGKGQVNHKLAFWLRDWRDAR